MPNILIADDEKEIIRLLKIYLNDYNVLEANDGQQALAILNSQQVDLAIVDIMMPKVDGYQLITKIREKSTYIPVIIVSAKVSLSDRILGMDIGADDYITKPFEPLEVQAKVRAQLRRLSASDAVARTETVTVGDVTLNVSECTVTKDGVTVELTKNEFKVLELLMGHPRRRCGQR